MKKILFVNHTGGMAGAEVVFIDALRAASEDKNNELFVVCPSDGDNSFKDALSGVDIKVLKRFPYRVLRSTILMSLRNFTFSLLSIPLLISFCIKNKIDIIYSNTSVNIIGLIVALILRKKHIWYIQEVSTVYHRWTPQSFDKIYKKLFLLNNNYSIFVSDITRTGWEQNIKLSIHNSIILYDKYKIIKPKKRISSQFFTFGYLGTFSNYKNVQKLIEVFSLLNEGKLLIGGYGIQKDELESQAKASPRCHDIEFLGTVTDLSDFYGSIDVLVQLSFNESWGLVALEAISAGIPVIMTRESGIIKILNSGQGCIFVDPTDTDLIYKMMNRMMIDGDWRREIVENGQTALDKCNLNGNFDNIIRQILRDA